MTTEQGGDHDPAVAMAYLLGLLVGEGHFGGDGRQPQVVLRMHTRHQALFHWLEATFPGGKLYGPYTHGGRSYYQWMARGRYLREVLAPLIRRHDRWLDDHALSRFESMCERYAIALDDRGAGPVELALGGDLRDHRHGGVVPRLGS